MQEGRGGMLPVAQALTALVLVPLQRQQVAWWLQREHSCRCLWRVLSAHSAVF